MSNPDTNIKETCIEFMEGFISRFAKAGPKTPERTEALAGLRQTVEEIRKLRYLVITETLDYDDVTVCLVANYTNDRDGYCPQYLFDMGNLRHTMRSLRKDTIAHYAERYDIKPSNITLVTGDGRSGAPLAPPDPPKLVALPDARSQSSKSKA